MPQDSATRAATPSDADQSERQKISGRWVPIYPTYSKSDKRSGLKIANSLPVDWRCPCGSMLYGGKSCPKCGRVILDGIQKMDTPQYIKDSRDGRAWKRFGKRRWV